MSKITQITIKILSIVLAVSMLTNLSLTSMVKADEEILYIINNHQYDEDDGFVLRVGDWGRFETYEVEGVIDKCDIESSNPNVVQIGPDNSYKAVGKGTCILTFTEKDGGYFDASYLVTVEETYSDLKLSKTNLDMYYAPNGYAINTVSVLTNKDISKCIWGWSFTHISGKLNSNYISVNWDLNKKIVTIAASREGVGEIHLSMEDAYLTIRINVKKFNINKHSSLLVKGKTTKLKLKNYNKSIKWKTTNKKVATVSSSGKVRGKKIGTAVIYTIVDRNYVGCAVSVVKPKMKTIINKAKSLAKGKYSQARRMRKGYYDCSSLVWRAYAKAKKYLGNRYYAPVAAELARKYKKKKIKGGLKRKTLNKMKYRPGDLLFREGARNGRYRGIYHVEMFIGYNCLGCDAKGKPVLEAKWATVRNDYYPYDGGMMVRPWK